MSSAGLDNGAVILAGLDRRCDAEEWAAIEYDEAHPQYLLANLLREFELTPADIRDWPEGAPALRDAAGVSRAPTAA